MKSTTVPSEDGSRPTASAFDPALSATCTYNLNITTGKGEEAVAVHGSFTVPQAIHPAEYFRARDTFETIIKLVVLEAGSRAWFRYLTELYEKHQKAEELARAQSTTSTGANPPANRPGFVPMKPMTEPGPYQPPIPVFPEDDASENNLTTPIVPFEDMKPRTRKKNLPLPPATAAVIGKLLSRIEQAA